MKILMLAGVFLLCAGAGIAYLLELISRSRQISQMLEWIRFVRREIRCTGAPLHRIFSAEDCPKSLPVLRDMDLSEPFDLAESYRKAKKTAFSETFFLPEDWKLADDLFGALGQGDLEAQEQCLIHAEESFLRAEEESKKRVSTGGKPAVVLGCSAGAVLVLMLL